MSAIDTLYCGSDSHPERLYYLGRVLSNRAMSISEVCDMLSVDMEALKEEYGDDVDVISFVVVSSDAPDYQPGDAVETKFAFFHTPKGTRHLEIPWVPGADVWDLVGIVSGEVWDNVPDDGLTIGDTPIGERFEEGDFDTDSMDGLIPEAVE